MAQRYSGDTHIDYFEVGEYGDHFVSESKKLDNETTLVNVPALRARVAAAVAAVHSELEKADITRSALRKGRDETSASSVVLRKEIEKFYSYLGSLDDDVAFDKEAFFPGDKLGNLSQLKPADLRSRADDILRGFNVTANTQLPNAATWKTKLEKARDAAASAVQGKGSSNTASIIGTAGLIAARERFLKIYGVAKRLVRGALIDLERENEYRLFFADLQVNEGPLNKSP